MSTIDVYAFEEEGDESATDWTTQSITEAREYAQKHGYALIAREYEYSDSSLVEDYRPGHNLDGTKIEECKKCGSALVGGLCADETCPYSDRNQDAEYTEG